MRESIIGMLLTFMLFHLCSYILEFIYQRWCFPMTFGGFFMSMFTSSSLVCTKMREFSILFDNMFVSGVLAIVTQIIKDKKI